MSSEQFIFGAARSLCRLTL